MIPEPASGRPDSDSTARTLLVALLVAVAVAAFGVPYALIWSAVAPDIPLIRVEGGVVPASPEPEQMIAGDGWFTFLGLGFGVVAGVATWLIVRRRRGPLVLLGMAIGAVASGVLAGWLGQRIGLSGYGRAVAAAAPGAELSHPPDLRVAALHWFGGVLPDVRGVLLIEAFVAVLVYTLLAGWSRHGSLRPEPADRQWAAAPGYPGYPGSAQSGYPGTSYAGPEQPGYGPPAHGEDGSAGAVSSGSSGPPDPPAEPGPPAPGEAAPPRD